MCENKSDGLNDMDKKENKNDLPIRKQIRIKDYDYSQNGYYFVTICSHEKECIFGEPESLNHNGKAAELCLQRIQDIYPWILVDKYVVMPNHVHVILIVNETDKKIPITSIVGQYKMAVTKMVRKLEPDKIVWQRSFHDHVIRSQKSYEKIWCYIEDNPRKWEEDCFYMRINDE